MHLESNNMGMISGLATEESLFGVLENFPLSTTLSILAIILISVFFITSADSGTFVLAMMTTNGSLNPSNRLKVIWGVLLAAMALVLLYSGGLQALQNTMIIAALPFSIVIAIMAVSLLKSVNQEVKEFRQANLKSKRQS